MECAVFRGCAHYICFKHKLVQQLWYIYLDKMNHIIVHTLVTVRTMSVEVARGPSLPVIL